MPSFENSARRILLGSAGLVVYTFAGYPAIMAARARLQPRPVRSDPGHRPTISLIVAACDEEDFIAEKLEQIGQLDYPRELIELVVAADGSRDRTVEIASAHENVRVMHRPERRGKLAAVERAIAATRGEIIVLTDANNRFTRETLIELTAPFADPVVGGVTGRKAIDDGTGRPLDRVENLYWRYESALKSWESATGSTAAAAGEILAIRREAYRSPPEGSVTEDFVAAMLTAADGWRFVYAPKAVSLERASATLSDEQTRRARIVFGRWQAVAGLMPALVKRPGLALRVISHKGLRPLVPWAMLGVALPSLLLARAGMLARALVVAQAVFYAAATVGARDERQGRKRLWAFAPLYFCRMNFATLRGSRDILLRRDLRAWRRVPRG